MRWVDPSVVLAACGSSHRNMATYGAWEYDVLERTFDHVEMISLHTYFTNPTDRIEDFFGVLELMDTFIKEVVAIADAVAAKRRSPKRIMLSFDEWNVWYRARGNTFQNTGGWPEAPKLIEEVYNFEDALIAGGALITLMNNGDRVKAACLAQLVNAIGAIMTETGGPAWRQTISIRSRSVRATAAGPSCGRRPIARLSPTATRRSCRRSFQQSWTIVPQARLQSSR